MARVFGPRAPFGGVCLALVALAFGWTSAAANVAVTPAAGGADLTVGQFAALSGPTVAEAVAGEIGTGTIVLRLPSGFEFDTAPNAVTARVSGAGRCRGNDRPLWLSGGASQTVTAAPTSVTVTVAQSSSGRCTGAITWSGLRVRATQAGRGDLTNAGTSLIAGAPPGARLGPLSTGPTPTPGSATPTTTPTWTGTSTPSGTPAVTGTPTRTPTAGGRPVNDAFAAAPALTAPSSVSGSTVGATTESGEPTDCGAVASVWYRLQPAASGLLSIVLTSGSYNPGLVLYRGTAFGMLTQMQCTLGQIRQDVVAGQTYYLRVGDQGGATGTFAFDVALSTVPPNDAFASALALSVPGSVSGDNGGATTEAGEPLPCHAMTKTAWYRVTAPADGTLVATADASRFAAVVALYRGEALSGLTPLGCDDDFRMGEASAPVVAGQSYYVQVGGQNDFNTGSGGAYTLRVALHPASLAFDAAAPPPNDAQAAAAGLAVPGAVTGATDLATSETPEPYACGVMAKTVWFRLVPQAAGTLTVDTAGSAFDTTLGLYRNEGGLSLIGCNDDYAGALQARLSSPVEAGRTYWVQLGSFQGHGGAYTLRVALDGGAPTPTPAPGAPANDAFAGAAPLALPGSTGGDLRPATVESGEPACGGTYVGHTVWYRLTPASDGRLVAFSTTDYSFQTLLALYRGTSLADAVRLACSDWVGYEGPAGARLSANVLAGQTYYLQVGGWGGSGGPFMLDARVDPPLVNDAFAGAVTLAVPTTVVENTQAATTEPGEPTVCREPGGGQYSLNRTVWYRVVPSASGTLHLDSGGSSINTVLAVRTGPSLDALTEVGCNDQDSSTVGPARLSLPVVAGQPYYVQLGDYAPSSSYVPGGRFKLDLSLGPPPANDDFAGGAELAAPGSASGDTTWSTNEPGEPLLCGYKPYRTVWYRVTPAASGWLSAGVRSASAGFAPMLALYSGATVSALTRLDCSYPDGLGADVVAGQTYYLQVAGDVGTSGGYALDVALEPRPANDAFADAAALAIPGAAAGNNRAATTEAGEPAPPCGAATGKTVWYRLTPSRDGTLVLDATGPSYTGLLALYAGSSLGALTPVACSDGFGGGQEHLRAAVSAGQSYYAQLGAWGNSYGDYTLSAQVAEEMTPTPTPSPTPTSSPTPRPPPPPSDGFAGAGVLDAPNVATGTTSSATLEGGEPRPCGAIGRTVWYRLEPSRGVAITASTGGSNYDTVLAIYSGTSLSALTLIACNDDSGGTYQSEVNATLAAGQVYYLQLGGYNGAYGAFALRLSTP